MPSWSSASGETTMKQRFQTKSHPTKTPMVELLEDARSSSPSPSPVDNGEASPGGSAPRGGDDAGQLQNSAPLQTLKDGSHDDSLKFGCCQGASGYQAPAVVMAPVARPWPLSWSCQVPVVTRPWPLSWRRLPGPDRCQVPVVTRPWPLSWRRLPGPGRCQVPVVTRPWPLSWRRLPGTGGYQALAVVMAPVAKRGRSGLRFAQSAVPRRRAGRWGRAPPPKRLGEKGGLRTPPEKKKEKKEVEEIIPITEEPEKDDVLNAEDILALAIKPEDLHKLHVPRAPLKAIPTTNRILIRKLKPKEEVMVKRLVAKPTLPLDELRTMDYTGPGGPWFDVEGRVLPHSILGSLVDFKHELLARGLTEMANTISEHLPSEVKSQNLPVCEKKPKEIICTNLHNQDHALANWQWHMEERKRTQNVLSNLLKKPVENLMMNQSDDLGQMRQQSIFIDQTVAALGPGKGYRIGSEFWSLPPMIGDELSGVRATLNQTERGFPPPVVHIGKPQTIKQETGTDFLDGRSYSKNYKSENTYLKQRLEEMKIVLRQLDFKEPDIDQLEIIGTGRPYSSMSVEHFRIEDDHCTTLNKENIELLDTYPDVIEEPIIGPSITFCGHPARWLKDTTSHKDEVGMIVRLTFEAMAGDRASSCLELVNNGTTVIYYKWKRLPEPQHCVKPPSDTRMPRFYFNINSGIILPGETINLPFTFKSPNAGIFTDLWEFCTHPVLLAGASLQVALWGVAVFADRNEGARQQLQQELEKKEKIAIVEHLLDEVVAGVHTPQRSQSPLGISLTEEEIFKKKNPKLHYRYEIVQSLKELWNECFVKSKGEEEAKGESRHGYVNILSIKEPSKGAIYFPSTSFQHSEPAKNVKAPDEDSPFKVQTVESEPQWDLSVTSFRQDVLSLLEDEHLKEKALEHLNLKVLELSMAPIKMQEDTFYKTFYQLWLEAVDGLVSTSMRLREILGLPEKETETSVVDETADSRKQTKKDENKTTDRKGKRVTRSAGKEDEREKRQSGKKARSKDDKKTISPISARSSRQLLDSKENLLQDQHQTDPVIHKLYREKLYTEVYGLLSSMMSEISFLFEEMKWKHMDPADKCV
ncbi:MYCBP-associated protein [Hemitrygon akajei]|uniref:MYCBP-associated protein n=1 Tax=Hemitrygon akajei TaxID=2704970 RepID=UPI003BF9ECBB